MEVVATAGHVDHGKSALVRRLTGMEPDRFAEERRRGLTIDLGYVWTQLPTGDGATLTVAFVDVPGHDDFLPNMLCGVGVVEQVLFVVAADDGWSAQSQEHLEILDLLERRGVVAVVTKADLAGTDRTAEVVTDVRARLDATSLADTPVLAVDSVTGTGFDVLTATIAERLTTVGRHRPAADPTAAASSDHGAVGAANAADTRAARLWIDRVFTVRGAGTVVTGMLTAGRLEVGQDVEVAPRTARGRIRGLQQLEQDVPAADAGARVAVNLAGVDHDSLRRGDTLVSVGRGPRTGPVTRPGTRTAGRAGTRTASGGTDSHQTVDVDLRALPHGPIGRRGAWHVHVGSAATTARVLPVLDELEAGARGPARLELAEPLPLRAGDRFVLREAGRRRTAGGGIVLDPAPRRRRRGTDQRLAHALVLEQLAAANSPERWVTGLVDAHGGVRSLTDLQAALGTDVDAAGMPGLALVGGAAVRSDRLHVWTHAALAVAADASDDVAIELAGLTRAAIEAGCPRELAAAVVDRAVERGELHRRGGRVVHADHERAYAAARDDRRHRFLAALTAAGCSPPDPNEVAKEAGIPSFEVQELLDAGEVVACGGLLFTAGAVAAAVERLREGPGRDGAPFTASDARQAWETSRRSAMPLLDHLRTTGVTTFDGDQHRLIGP